MRSSLYTPKTKTGSGQMTNQGKGTYTDTPKTKGSVRTLKLPDFIFDMLREYKQWQDGQRTALGDQWQDYDRLFTCYNGAPMSPSTPSNWLTRFQAKNGLRRVTTHSFRHLNASILIYENLDAKTVSACLGHSNVTTTLDIYTHEFNRAKARSSEALTKAIDFNPKKKK
jgi:integrase